MRRILTTALLGVAAGLGPTALAGAAPTPCVAPYPTPTTEAAGAAAFGQATLCETPVTQFGQADIRYTVKFWNGTYNPRITTKLSYVAIRRQPGSVGVDEFPPSTRPAGRPAVLFVHGGAFVAGDRYEMQAYARLFARRGFVSVLPDYALMPLTDFSNLNLGTTLNIDNVSQSAQRDIQTAVRNLKARKTELGIDPAKIYVAGISAGAITAIRTATRSQDTGDVAFRDAGALPLVPTQGAQSSTVAGAFAISGVECYAGHPNSVNISGAVFRYGPCLTDTSTAGDAPFRMVHGLADSTLHNSWGQQTCAAYPAQCRSFTSFAVFPSSENGLSTHSDGSVGTCANGGSSNGGGDHFLSDPNKCPARAGVDAKGVDGPSFQANLGLPTASVARQLYTFVKSLDP